MTRSPKFVLLSVAIIALVCVVVLQSPSPGRDGGQTFFGQWRGFPLDRTEGNNNVVGFQSDGNGVSSLSDGDDKDVSFGDGSASQDFSTEVEGPEGLQSSCARRLFSVLKMGTSIRMEESVGYPATPFMGVVLDVLGNGTIHHELIHRVKFWRGKNIVKVIQGAAKTLTKPTVFYFCAHDVDLWTLMQDYRWQTKAMEAALLQVLGDCPSLYFLSWNPSAHPRTGRLGYRTIPIPDYQAFIDYSKIIAPPYVERRRGISFRGTTTGRWERGDYRNSDRYLAVKAFQNISGADVKFFRRMQGVNKVIVPDSMMGGTRSIDQLIQMQIVLDVDGNANAWTALRWKLMSGSVVLKVESHRNFVQWYYPRLRDWKQLKLVDIRKHNIVKYAVGLSRNVTHCERMSREAREFGLKHLTPQAAMLYLVTTIRDIHKIALRYADADWRIRAYRV